MMKEKIKRGFIFSAPLLAAAVTLNAIAQRLPANDLNVDEFRQRVDGRQSPASVPKELVLRQLFSDYGPELDWANDDRNTIKSFANFYAEQKAQNLAFVAEAADRACANYILTPNSTEGNVYAFLTDMASTRAEELNRMDALYAEFYGTLSRDGQRNLSAAVSERIAPTIRHSEFDLAKLALAALEAPEVAVRLFQQIRRKCEAGFVRTDEAGAPAHLESDGGLSSAIAQ